MDVPQEELSGHQPLSTDWPLHGLIEFQNVTMRYKPSLPAALRDVTFTIEGGTQVRTHIKPEIHYCTVCIHLYDSVFEIDGLNG